MKNRVSRYFKQACEKITADYYTKYVVVFLFMWGCFFSCAQAQEIAGFPPITKKDSILILAPHPDDEIIGCAGIIQEALRTGAAVKVVLLTNGDNNELSFIFYEKRLTLKKKEFIHMGEVRCKESLDALASLGVKREDVIFLGYPDFGTMEIFTKYWNTKKPFRSMLTRVKKVPYPEAFSANAPYVGESILNDLKVLIAKSKPTKIFVAHPADTNRDHRALYLFLRVALWDLEKQIGTPDVYPYLVHIPGWPYPRGYHPELKQVIPQKLKENKTFWYEYILGEEQLAKKHYAVSLYKSQIAYNPPYLYSFVRTNEFFGDYPVIKIAKKEKNTFHWYALSESYDDKKVRNNISSLSYARKDNDVWVKITLKKKISKNFGISFFLIGYSKTKDFARMPKMHCTIGLSGLHLRDKKQTVFIKDVRVQSIGKTWLVNIPLARLGDPDFILACARTSIGDLPFDNTAWRILNVGDREGL